MKKKEENENKLLQSDVRLHQNRLVYANKKQSYALIHLDFSFPSEISTFNL